MPPSPNVQANVSESPSASVEAAPEKLTASGTVPLCGAPVAFATGGLFAAVVKLSGEAGGLGDVAPFAAPSADVTR